jgi:hypothetical protein
MKIKLLIISFLMVCCDNFKGSYVKITFIKGIK